jgi:hypothetical protein
MSLTGANHIFAGVHENGINTLLKAFLTARPHYINYGTSAFVPVTTASATNVPTIAFPGIPGGIQYAVRFSIPVVDLFPPDGASPLPPGPGELNLRVDVMLVVGCMKWVGTVGNEKPGTMVPLRTVLTVWAKGKPDARYFSPGNGDVGFVLEDVKIPALACVGGKPDTFEAVVECIIRMVLQAFLSNLRLPFHALSVGFVNLILERGPEISDDQLKIWGDIS